MEYNQLRYDRSYSVRQFPVLHFPRMGVRVGTTRHQGDRISAGTHIHVGTRLGFLSVDIESRCARHVNNHTASSPRVDNYRRLHGNCVGTTGIPQTPREIHRNARIPPGRWALYIMCQLRGAAMLWKSCRRSKSASESIKYDFNNG